MDEKLIDRLLEEAEELIVKNVDKPLPRFSIDADCEKHHHLFIEKQDSGIKGKGFFAKDAIEAGRIILVAKPLAVTMGWELLDLDEDENSTDQDSADESGQTVSETNGLLTLRLCQKIQKDPSIWSDYLCNLFPREEEKNELPDCECKNTSIQEKINSILKSLEKNELIGRETSESIRTRLARIVRYNCLSIETSPELLSHPNPGGFSSLSGTALYYEPSFFNHSSEPNVSRWNIGDIIFFVVNRNVAKGKEMCISYIESEYLCEGPSRRTSLLNMDFTEKDIQQSHGENKVLEKEFPIIDLDVQDELMSIPAFSRVDTLFDLLYQATAGKDGKCHDDGEVDHDVHEDSFFQCDEYNLNLLLALTLDEIGRTEEALGRWEKCIEFTVNCLPPADETCVPIRVQAALCAKAAGKNELAQEHANEALCLHNLLFGGGVRRFRKRYAKEVELKLRPSFKKSVLVGQIALDTLWPI